MQDIITKQKQRKNYLRKVDNLIKHEKGLSNSRITGANNTKVSGQSISETMINSFTNSLK